ncbi:MAG: FAD-dependent oxidoreductase [Pseudomonadota bacterium]
MSDVSNRLILIGGGHSHVAVLADWIRGGLPDAEIALISPSSHLRYSGMVPGWISGEYGRDEGLLDIAALAKRAGIRFVQDSCTAIDPDAGTVCTAAGHSFKFDFCSINVGGVGRASEVLGTDQRIIDVRPIGGFVERLTQWQSEKGSDIRQVTVVGGGAGGVELAFALRNRLEETGSRIRLIAGAAGLLPEFASSVRKAVGAELAAQSIDLIEQDAGRVSEVLIPGSGQFGSDDLIVAALGSGAPNWPRQGGLAADKSGFIAVDRFQRSVSHPKVFAVGDIASRQDRNVPHSGVHAVHTGPVLAANLRSVLQGEYPARSYTPRPTSLYLISTGNGLAIASYGPFAAKGRWVAKLKRRIDKGWIATYAKMAHDQ